MIRQVEEYFIKFYKDKGGFKKILDVGSRDVNGNIFGIMNIGHFGKKALISGVDQFVGVDMYKDAESKGVDIKLNAHDLDQEWKEPTFDLVTCTEMLEHDDMFWLSVEQMRKVLVTGGYLFITVPSLSHGLHNHPKDYYRFFETVLTDVFFKGMEDVHTKSFSWGGNKGNVRMPDAVMGYARK